MIEEVQLDNTQFTILHILNNNKPGPTGFIVVKN